MSAKEILDELNLIDEHARLEGKHGREVGRSVWESISAFANEPDLSGGTIILGVERNPSREGPRYVAVGVPNSDKTQADLASQCANVFNTPVRPQITVEDLNGKTVVLAYIPESSPAEKPIFIKSVGLPRGAFRRIGSTDQSCTDEDLAILFDGRGHESFDYSAIKDASLEDINLGALEDYRTIRRSHGDISDVLGWGDIDLLKALGCIREIEANRWVPTVAGILLFGTKMALRRWFPMVRVDYIRIQGKEWIESPENRFETIEIQDTLFQLIQKAQATTLDDLPRSFALREGASQREDLPLIPQRVIREAIVNALMHRSYQSCGSIQIVRYSNRIEIRNPGYSIKDVDRLGEPGSFARNPHIAAVLHETRFAETKGSGIKAMNLYMGSVGLPPPTFESDRRLNQFQSTFLIHHLLNEDEFVWLSKFKSSIHAPEDAQALVYVREFGKIDNATYRNLAQTDTLTASSRLRRLRDSGLLEQRERGTATYYIPTQYLLDPEQHPLPEETAARIGGVGYQPMLFDIYADQGPQVEIADQDQSETKSHFPNPSPTSWQYQSLGLSLEASEIAKKYSIGPKMPRPMVIQLIREICTIHPLTADQIATLLRRPKDDVIREFLTPMVEKGQLEYTLQNSPTHPRQSYKTPQILK